MPPSMNLSPARGPSAWDRLERRSKLERIGVVLLSSGAAATTAALARRRGLSWMFAAGAAGLAAGLLWQGSRRNLTHAFRRPKEDDAIDRASADSFPASDPPSIPAAATTNP